MDAGVSVWGREEEAFAKREEAIGVEGGDQKDLIGLTFGVGAVSLDGDADLAKKQAHEFCLGAQNHDLRFAVFLARQKPFHFEAVAPESDVSAAEQRHFAHVGEGGGPFDGIAGGHE